MCTTLVLLFLSSCGSQPMIPSCNAAYHPISGLELSLTIGHFNDHCRLRTSLRLVPVIYRLRQLIHAIQFCQTTNKKGRIGASAILQSQSLSSNFLARAQS
ncbi:hypothetical protein DFH05DRAFT_453013 [Lentinula detonsa]|uniref:Secreted protein n=1 Tax=Lentinula detonsa TaxID=2804962 RepID=A0A9W8NT04_9AGAR|nr:hypothetical protein DFH05DRAFT_453013 [Lentinula detonsa]